MIIYYFAFLIFTWKIFALLLQNLTKKIGIAKIKSTINAVIIGPK
jgi:hypothetical protein